MKVKKVNRYWCEFCKKAGLSSGHMRRHENGCTLNPGRICGVCKMDHGDFSPTNPAEQKPITEMIALLPDSDKFKVDNETGGFYFSNDLTKAVNEALPKLREASGNCPACIMAALRQRHIPVPMATDFNWTKEMGEIWSNINESRRGADDYY